MNKVEFQSFVKSIICYLPAAIGGNFDAADSASNHASTLEPHDPKLAAFFTAQARLCTEIGDIQEQMQKYLDDRR